MKKWIARRFYKGKYVVLNIVTANKGLRKYYEIPNGNQVTILSLEKSFTIDDDKIIFSNGEPNLYYNESAVTPINFFPSEEDLGFFGEMTPNKLFAGLENKLINQLFSQFGKSDKIDLGVLLSVFSILLILGLAVFMYVSFGDLTKLINQMNEIIEQLWG